MICPLAIISVGLASFISKGGRLFGIVVMLIGGWFLLSPFIDFEIKTIYIIAIFITFVGVSVIINFFSTKQLSDNANIGTNEFIFFSAREEKITDKNYKGSQATIIFGGLQLDLSEMEITQDIHISLNSMFGGVELILPENVKLNLKTSAIFGGVDAKKVKQSNEPNAPTIHVNVFALFGGMEIKNR